MKIWVYALCAIIPALSAEAHENWFLPYAPDDHTVALLHFDGQGEAEPNAAHPPAFKLVGGATRAPGQFGGGVVLDGAKAAVNAPPHEAFRLRTDQDFTLEMWARPDAPEEGTVISVGTRFYLKINPREHTGVFGYRAASFPIRSFPLTELPIVRGQWQHIALTHTRDRLVSLFVNGVLAGTLTHTAEGDFGKGGGVNIGSHDGWTGYLEGAIDEVRISDCVREYGPLLERRYYLKGEKVRLLVDPSRMPPQVAQLRVRVTGPSGKTIFDRTLHRAAMAQDLFPASDLPPGEHKVQITFSDGAGKPLSSVITPIGYANDLPDKLRERLAAVEKVCEPQKNQASVERIESARLLARSARDRMEQRDFRTAESRTAAAERIAAALISGEAAYRAAARQTARSNPRPRDVRVTMSWNGGERAAEALPWAKRLGANELAASHGDATPEGIALWKKAGFHTVMLSGSTIHDGAWLKAHPEQAQFGYWVTDPVVARGPEVEIPIASPRWAQRISVHFDPKSHWKVVDATGAKTVAPADWDFDSKAKRTRLRSAVLGHGYKVYFMIECDEVGDPLLPAFADHGLAKLDEMLAPYKGVLDTHWFDDLSYAYPGPTPQGPWDWESYTMAARPETRERFTRQTGIAFDPEWLVMAPRTIDVPPAPQYLAWMSWVQKELRPWLARASAVCRKYGMRSWLYWGDCHVGVEPYRGSLDAGIHEIDKPAGDPVTARALVDFPGPAKRRLRVEWLFPHVAASDASADRLLTQWARARRGLLMKPADGIYWMPFPDVVAGRDAGVREDIVEALAEINDEFRLIGDRLLGAEAFKHDIDLYVVHSWGSVYSWRPWGSPLLTHLTDLPVRVHFVSFAEVEETGIPEDADALFLYGLPGTSWSGGPWWASGKVATAVKGFLEKGGGVIALQAPSHLSTPRPHWALGDLLGVRAEGTSEYQPTQADLSQLADAGVTSDERKGEALLIPTKRPHWVSANPQVIAGLHDTVRVAALPDAQVVYAARSGKGAAPGVVISEPGKGRVAYFCGWSAEYAFSRLMRRAVFWVARKEADLRRLDVSGGEDLFLYAYPGEQLLALATNAAVPVKATLRCDPAILGVKDKARLVDVATGQVTWEGDAAELSAGIAIESVPRCVRLLQARRGAEPF